jgi:V8-like Glu-specific endopeptidase
LVVGRLLGCSTMRSTRSLKVALFVSLLAATACESDRPAKTDAAHDVSRSSIIKGSVSGSNEDAALLLMMYAGDKLSQRCTGTLVAPNLVVTARHCTAETVDQNIVCTADGKAESGGGAYKKDRDVASMYIYTGSNAAGPAAAKDTPDAIGKTLVYDTNVSNMCQGDLAFIVLDRPIGKVTPAKVRLTANAQVGETLMLAGYGLTEDGEVSTQRLTRSTSVVAVGPIAQDAYDLSANEYATGEGDCRGDSGGPAFDQSGALVGVLSRGGGGKTKVDNAANGCIGPGATNIRTSLFALKSLVERAFDASGNSLNPPAPADEGEKISLEDAYPNQPKNERPMVEPPAAGPSSSDSSGCTVSHASLVGDGIIAVLSTLLLGWMFRNSSRKRGRRGVVGRERG